MKQNTPNFFLCIKKSYWYTVVGNSGFDSCFYFYFGEITLTTRVTKFCSKSWKFRIAAEWQKPFWWRFSCLWGQTARCALQMPVRGRACSLPCTAGKSPKQLTHSFLPCTKFSLSPGVLQHFERLELKGHQYIKNKIFLEHFCPRTLP